MFISNYVWIPILLCWSEVCTTIFNSNTQRKLRQALLKMSDTTQRHQIRPELLQVPPHCHLSWNSFPEIPPPCSP